MSEVGGIGDELDEGTGNDDVEGANDENNKDVNEGAPDAIDEDAVAEDPAPGVSIDEVAAVRVVSLRKSKANLLTLAWRAFTWGDSVVEYYGDG